MSLLCLAITLDTHELILIIFDQSVTKKVGNKKVLYFPTSPNLCFCTTWRNEETKIASFHSDAVLWHCQTAASCWLNLFSCSCCYM